jgi:uncharacterized protein
MICTPSAGASTINWATPIELRDGTKLNATVYGPDDQKSPLPVIMTLTPYIGDTFHSVAAYFADHGYVFVVVDCRGRGNSEGKFEAFVNDAADGFDVVEALARMPFSDGQVAIWGGSYQGMNQWQIAKGRPPHLKTIVPVAAPVLGYDAPTRRNIGVPYNIQWATFTSGRTANNNIFYDNDYWLKIFDRFYREKRPFNSLDVFAGNVTTDFQTWVKYPRPDAFWDKINPTTAELARIDIPILSITGAYDDPSQLGTLRHYENQLKANSRLALSNHYVLIGPWDHSGTRRPKLSYGGVEFGSEALLDVKALHVAWYDWVMKGGARPAFLKDKVTWFTVGLNRWQSAPTLAAATRRRDVLTLVSPGGNPDNLFRAGELSAAKPTRADEDMFRSDPSVIDKADYEMTPGDAVLLEQRDVLAIDGDGLVYQTPVLKEPMILTGRPEARLNLMIDTPDADLWVRLYEVRSDGSSVKLSDDLMRARYRRDPRKPTPVVPGKSELYTFDQFLWLSRKIDAGSRLRLVITGVNSRNWEKNYNSGGIVAEESGKDARVATIRLSSSPQSPSTLSLPIGQ